MQGSILFSMAKQRPFCMDRPFCIDLKVLNIYKAEWHFDRFSDQQGAKNPLHAFVVCVETMLFSISLTVFPSQFKFDEKFDSLSHRFSDCYETVALSWHCRGMCTNMLWSDGGPRNNSKRKFPSNVNYGLKNTLVKRAQAVSAIPCFSNNQDSNVFLANLLWCLLGPRLKYSTTQFKQPILVADGGRIPGRQNNDKNGRHLANASSKCTHCK